MTREELTALIDAGHIDECVKAFAGMPEASRLKLGSAAVARLRALGKGIPASAGFVFNTDPDPQIMSMLKMDTPVPARYRAARAAVLATASFSQWQSVRGQGLPSNELTLRILRDRRPSWLGEMIELVCEGDDENNPRWDLVRSLVREGLCDPPKSGRYIDRMLQTLPGEAWRSGVALKDILLADSGLLEVEIWRIFETEPGPRAVQVIGSATQTGRPETTWEVALVELAQEGRIARERLLEACLDGLSRDLHDARAKFFAQVHDRLEPTPEELSARRQRYLDFLGSRNPSTIGFALKLLKVFVKAGEIDGSDVVDRLAPALHARTKATVKQALAILEMAARPSKDLALNARAVTVAIEGLVHESADIQEEILGFLERHGDPRDRSLCELLMTRLDAIAPSLRGRFEAWLGIQEAPKEEPAEDGLPALERRTAALEPRLAALAGVPEALAFASRERAELPALTFDGTEIPRLDPARRLTPLDDLDALIELCARTVESLESEDEIGRCLDAISRLCDQWPITLGKRTAPLALRMEQRLGARAGMQAYAVHPLGVVIWSWLNRQDPYALCGPWSKVDFLMAWTRGLAQRVARGQAAPLLAAPTHSGGWIDPRVLLERFRERCKLAVADEPEDLILAMLRLAPDHRADALQDARDLHGEQGAAIRYALGSQDETIGPTAALWVAAARARSPWGDDPAVEARHTGLGPDAGRAATYHIDGSVLLKRLATEMILEIQRQPEVPESVKNASDLPTVNGPSSATLWPLALDWFWARGAKEILRFHESSSDWPWGMAYLFPLADPDVPLRPMARFLLALSLNERLPALVGLATDVLIAAIDDGRMDAESLGESLCLAWQLRVETWTYRPAQESAPDTPPFAVIVKPNRLAKALGAVARASPQHARVVARAVERILTDEATTCRTTSSLTPLLELLREASVESGRAVSSQFRAYLEKIESGGKTGRIVKNLLALRDLPDSPARRQERTQVLARRIARAERWQVWEGAPP